MPKPKSKPKQYRYAEGTTVPVMDSQSEVRKFLVDKMGSTKYGLLWDGKNEAIGFELFGVAHQIKVPPSQEEKEHRRAWRCVLLFVKTMWESIQSGIVTIEQATLGTALLPSNKTVFEELPSQVQIAKQTGQMPNLFPQLTEGE